MDLVELHRRGVAEFDHRVAGIGSDQWELPTPCTEWNVRHLVNHLVYENRWTVPILEGVAAAEVGDRFDGDLVGHDPEAAWAEASAAALAAVARPGITETTVSLMRGPTPAAQYLRELWADHLIHAWDLARATGQDERLPPDLVEAGYAQWKPLEPVLNASGLFGSHVEPPPDADLQTMLLAVTGRVA